MAEQRERWTTRRSFILAAVGSAVGLGNLWRFPTIAAQNGGGAFLIPYFIALVTAGIPLLIVEFGLGHMHQGAAPTAFKKANKRFEWVGWWSLMCSVVVATYYCVIMAWSLNYLVHSFNVAWRPPGTPQDYPVTFFDKEFLRVAEAGGNPFNLAGVALPIVLGLAITWIAIYLIISKGIGQVSKVVLITVPMPFILLALLFIRAIMMRGAVTGMDIYLTPDFSRIFDAKVWLAAYGQMFFSLSIGFGTLTAYASFLPKKADINNSAFITALGDCGTSFFAGMVVFSVIGFLAFAQADAGFQYDSIVARQYIERLNGLKDKDPAGLEEPADREDYAVLEGMARAAEVKDGKPAELVPEQIKAGVKPEHVRNFLARIVAREKGISVEQVEEKEIYRKATQITAEQSGPGLAFKVFPIAISMMPGIWQVVVGVLFFTMLLFLAIDSAFSLVEGIVAGLHDKFGVSRLKATAIVCALCFFVGMLFCTYAGLLWLDIVDQWINSYGLVLVGLFEAILVGWVIKTAAFREHVNRHSEIKIGLLWNICVKVLTPIILGATVVLSIGQDIKAPYGGYPIWSLIIGGWMMVLAVVGSGVLLSVLKERKKAQEAQAK